MNQNQTQEEKNYILIVDDYKKMLELIAMQLELRGFEHLLTAQTASQAIRLIEQYGKNISVAIVDWLILTDTGADVVKKCRAVDPLMGIIVISGQDLIDVKTESMAAGADLMLTKPIAHEILIQQVARFHSRSQAMKNIFNITRADDIVTLEDLNRCYVRKVVRFFEGNKKQAAEKLGVHRQTITSLLAEPD